MSEEKDEDFRYCSCETEHDCFGGMRSFKIKCKKLGWKGGVIPPFLKRFNSDEDEDN